MSAQNAMRLTKTVKKLEKPRPLKVAANQNRHSIIDSRLSSVEDVMALVDAVSMHIINGNYDKYLQSNIITLGTNLKIYGSQLEAIYKDQLDRAYVVFRNGCRDDRLDLTSRMQLLELIELRATNWVPCDNMNSYYKPKLSNLEAEIMPAPETPTHVGMTMPLLCPTSPPVQPPLLSPGEVIKTSGKFAKPTKIPGKNYCKDEVVIRNSDSGKVSPGAKERLVQITGPAEEKINYAKQLMEETIRRNASPVRPEQTERSERVGGSSSSLNSSASDDSSRLTQGNRSKLLHSFSTNDASLGEYKYTVTVGNHSIKIFGSNLDIVKTAKLLLDDFFSGDPEQYCSGDFYTAFEDEPIIPAAVPPTPTAQGPSRVSSMDSAATSESDETYKASSATPSAPVAPAPAPMHIAPAPVSVPAPAPTPSPALVAAAAAASGDAGVGVSATPSVDANQLTVVRQPLFPAAPREAFAAAEASARSMDVNARNRRALFAITNTQQPQQQQQQQQQQQPTLPAVAEGQQTKQEAETTNTPAPLKVRYSREFLLQLALSSYSSDIPQDWEQINADCPAIVKKATEKFDPVVYSQKWQEMDFHSIICASEIDSTDPE